MSRDQVIGGLLLIASIVVAVIYVWALFLSSETIVFLGMTIKQWAIVLPMLIAVLGVLAIVGWIGYTLATTPPPEEITFEEEEKKEGEKKEEEK